MKKHGALSMKSKFQEFPARRLMQHISSVRPTGKFPEKVENLSRFPGWNFRTEFRVPLYLHVSCSLYQFQVHGLAPRRTGVYDQMEQLFTNRKFHFAPTEISGFSP